jgi:hypothetical protein
MTEPTITRAGPAGKKYMSAEDFDAVIALMPNIIGPKRDAARAVMVDRKTYKDACKTTEGDLIPQALNYITGRIWMVYERYKAAEEVRKAEAAATLPPGWERVTLDAPAELIEQFRKKIEAARKKTRLDKEPG